MPGSDFDGRFVTLNGGLVIPAPANLLFLDLEARRFTVVRDGDVLKVTPSDRLTTEDYTSIRTWKRHLLLLLDYCHCDDADAHLRNVQERAKAS